MTIDQIASQVLRLPPHERAILAKAIWESLEDPYVFSCDISEAEAIELAKSRGMEIEKGDVLAIPHDELMAKLRK